MRNSLLTKVMASLVTLVLAMTMWGCVTFSSSSTTSSIDPVKFGRATALLYLSQKSKMDPNYVKAIENVYAAFDSTLSGTLDTQFDAYKVVLAKAVKDRLGDGADNAAAAIVAADLVDYFWTQVGNKFDIKGVIDEQTLDILKKFNSGIESAIEDWKTLGG